MGKKYSYYQNKIEALKGEGRLKKLTPMVPISGAYLLFEDEKLLTFCSHDYLGLADHPDVKKQAIHFLLEYGITPSCQSEDLYLACQKQLEEKLAKKLHRDTVQLFPSRFEANRMALSLLGHSDATIFIDEGCHPSLSQGAKLSHAEVKTFPHNRLDRLEEILEDTHGITKIIVTESVFSLTGNLANLPTLIDLAEHFDALLYVDDSHGFGIAGVDGMGLCTHLHEVDVIASSFSKALGAYGGLIACKQDLHDFLLSHAPASSSYVFPPPILGAIDAGIDLIEQMEGERKQLQQRSHWLRAALRNLQFNVSNSNIPLISLEFCSPEEVDSLRTCLREGGILVGPTHLFEGEERSTRLSLAINISHMPDHLAQLVEGIKQWQTGGCLAQAALN